MDQTSTLNIQEVEKFDALAANWWDMDGPMKPLHFMNPPRLEFIRDNLSSLLAGSLPGKPLSSVHLLDVGCGAGILAEPLARMGAQVTGLDASQAAIQVAQQRSQAEGLKISYYQGTIESFTKEGFDAICALEIIEHVDHPGTFLKACLQRLRPGGALFLSTLDRTVGSFFKAIVLAEYVLKWVPSGTHQWQKFIKPCEAAALLRTQGAKLTALKGIGFNPVTKMWYLTTLPQTNYILMAVKEGA